MLESATVQLPFLELDRMLKDAESLKNEVRELKKKIGSMDIDDFENDPYKKRLDNIYNFLDKASDCSQIEHKQYYIYKSMEEYCKAFCIPINEMMEGISNGVNPKEQNEEDQ